MENKYLEKRLDTIEKKFEDIDHLLGRAISNDAVVSQIKKDIEEIKKELKSALEEIDDNFRDPEKGIYGNLKEVKGKLNILETRAQALELKFDTRIDKMIPAVEQNSITRKTLVSIAGERLEKLESTIKQNEKQNQWFERFFQAAISAGFAILVALIKDCH